MSRSPRGDSWSFGSPHRPLYMRPRLRRLASIVAMTLSLAMITSSSFAAVWTDQADYPPGSTVNISGDAMLPDEWVGVQVLLPDGTLGHYNEVQADSEGRFVDSYLLPPPEAPVIGEYQVVATGFDSGAVYEHSFTDNTPTPTSLNAQNPTTNSIQLTWSGDANSNHTYRIERCLGANDGQCGASPEGAAAGTGSGSSWASASSATGASDNVCATTTGSTGQFWKNYGFSIPSGATITGVQVLLDVSATSSGGTRNLDVQVGKGEANVSSTALTVNPPTAACGAAPAISVVGSTSELWGLTWTPAEINSSDFTVEVSGAAGSGGNIRTRALDSVGVRVHWTKFVEVASQPGTSAQCPSNACSFTDVALSPSTTYGYRVRLEHSGLSPYSNTDFETTLTADSAAPTITFNQSPNGNNGWFKTGPATVNVSAADPSGILSLSCTLDGAPISLANLTAGTGSPRSGDVSTSAEGNHLVECTATDNSPAANSATDSTRLKLDTVAPTLSLAFTPNTPDGDNGWWKTPGGVPFQWTCSDTTSGIDATFGGGCPSPLAGTETAQGTTNFADQVKDEAGNTSVSVNRNLKLDNVAPTLTLAFTPNTPEGANSWWTTPGGVPFQWTCEDATSGIDATFGGGCPSPLSGTETSQGTTSFTDQVKDDAGNTSVLVNRDLKLDNVAPSISAALDRSPGTSGWFNSSTGAPTVEFTCADGGSGLASCPADHIFGEGQGQSHSGTAYDIAGNSATDGVTDVDVDTIAPSIVLDATADSCSLAGNAGWCRGTQTAGFTASDATSGVDAPPCTTAGDSPCDFTKDTTTDGSAVNIASGDVSDVAGNTASSIDAGPFKIDSVAPEITITTPTDGGSYSLNQAVAASYSCSDALSTIASCAGTVSNGVNINTSSVGSKNFTVDAEDQAGNTSTATHSYTVSYVFSGFFQPVDNSAVNSAKAGQAVPTKWRLTDYHGAGISDPSSFKSVMSVQGSGACQGAPVDAIEDYAGSSGLQYLGDGYWQFNWKTPKGYVGQCRTMKLYLNDGTTSGAVYKTASFQFK